MKTYQILFLSAVLTLGSCLLPAPSKKEALRPATFAEVEAGGDLKDRIAASLEVTLAAARDTKTLLAGDNPSREAGRALLGITTMSRAVGADRREADRFYNAVRGAIGRSGYLGAADRTTPDETVLEGHGWLVKGLCEYYIWTGESTALDIAQTVCDSVFVPRIEAIRDYPLRDREDTDTAARTGLWRVDADRPGSIFVAMEGLGKLYDLRRNANCRRVLDALADLHDNASPGDHRLSAAGYLAGIRGLVQYSLAKGSDQYRGRIEDAWNEFAEGSLNEICGAGAILGDTTITIDPEVASQAFITACRVWESTGQGDYLEQAEKIYFNALAPSQRRAGSFTPVVARDHNEKIYRCGADSCAGILPWVEALPEAARLGWFIRDNKVLVPLYRTGELTVESKNLKITQQTSYPLDSTVRFEIVEAPKRGVGLQVYFPSYMNIKSIRLNSSQNISGTVNSVGLLDLREIFRKGDVIVIQYSFGSKWSKPSNEEPRYRDMYKPVAGPMLLGYRADTLLWLERGVPIREYGDGFVLDPELEYTPPDSLTGFVNVDTVVRDLSHEQPVDESARLPEFRPLYVPLKEYGAGDILPEYIMVRIGK